MIRWSFFDTVKQKYSRLCCQITLLLGSLSVIISTVSGIGCYECTSRNGANPKCHDQFHPINNTYLAPCFAAREGHQGMFPGNFCLKIKGTIYATSTDKEQTIYARTCSVYDNGNMCGIFSFEDKDWNGCIKTCNTNGCNAANSHHFKSTAMPLVLIVLQLSLNILLFCSCV